MQTLRSLIVDVVDPYTNAQEAERNLLELKSLIRTFGSLDMGHIIQHRMKPDKNTFIGSGKLQEIYQIVHDEKINIIVLNAIVKPTQLFHITKSLWGVNPNIEVWDRVDLILHIFEKNATTAESKLQIEIARMNHMGPRISGLGGTLFSKQSGGVGGRGQGETNTELMKRHWRTLIKNKQIELAKHAQYRLNQLTRRKDQGIKHVALVGYTNAGKTTLFNVLTGKNKIMKDALFVTLDTTIGKIHTSSSTQITISDTIGFIQNLPPSLIETFKSTLMEAIHADLILHIADVTDEKRDMKIEVVQKILHEIGAGSVPQILIFTKADLLPEERWIEFAQLKKRYTTLSPLFISSTEKINIEKLLDTISHDVSQAK